MTTESEVREAFVKQIDWCRQLGSPFMMALCEAVAANLDRSTAVGRRMLDWQGQPDALGDAVPLRMAGALHALVRRGEAPDLAAAYPPQPTPGPDALWALIEAALVEHEAALLPWLEMAPQTNEVGRSAALMTGLLILAQETGLPVELYELGASAGLNLNLDRFEYDLGGLKTGAIGSGVKLAPAWTGAPPPGAKVTVLGRRGVDISPLSVAAPAHRERLTAYIWPDQAARLERVTAAIEIARTHPPALDVGDAAQWIERMLVPQGPKGVMRVIYHTIAFQYFPPDTQGRIRAHIAKIGAQATATCPLAWLRFESDPEFGHLASLRLTDWPHGQERVIGTANPHGSSFRLF